VYGPNSNLGHNSILFMIECQVNYIVRLLKLAKANPAWRYLQVTKEAVDRAYDTHVRKALVGKVRRGERRVGKQNGTSCCPVRMRVYCCLGSRIL
jgi:hypothetical protein